MKKDPESFSLGRGATEGLARAHRANAAAMFGPRPTPKPIAAQPAPVQEPTPVSKPEPTTELPICHGCRKPFTTLRRAQYLDKLDKAKYFCTTGCAIVFAVETVKAS